MVLNLFAGQQWNTDIENRLVDTEVERARQMETVAWKHMHYHL